MPIDGNRARQLRRGKGQYYCPACHRWKGEGSMTAFDKSAGQYITMDRCRQCHLKGHRP